MLLKKSGNIEGGVDEGDVRFVDFTPADALLFSLFCEELLNGLGALFKTGGKRAEFKGVVGEGFVFKGG